MNNPEHFVCISCTTCLFSLLLYLSCIWKSSSVSDTMYLKDQHPRVCHSQVDPHSLTVMCRVRSDAVHIQLPGHLQQVDVRLSRGQTPAQRGGLNGWKWVTVCEGNYKPSLHTAKSPVCDDYLCFLWNLMILWSKYSWLGTYCFISKWWQSSSSS